MLTGDTHRLIQHPGNGEYFVRGWISTSNIDRIEQVSREVDQVNGILSVSEATSGFQRPMTNDHYGWEWLDWNGSVYHPGDDYNGPGGGDSDCGTDILAVANGTVRYVNTGSWGGIVIEHLWQGITVYSQYGHVSSALVSVGQEVSKGQHVAEMGNVGADTCHLHWEIRESDHPNPTYGSYWDYGVLGNQSSVNNYYEDPEWWVDNHGPYADCPSSGGVILYQHASYDCGGEGEGTGYIVRSSTGWQNVPSGFNDQASSLRVPSGWSVRLYEHGDRAGASVCRNGDDTDFSGDTYDGSSTSLNDTISSFEVFDNSDCGGGSGGDTVTLYEHPDYWGTEYGWHDAGWFNVPDYMNDLASSIRIADGWSARVYEHSDRAGAAHCYNDDDNNFSDEGFDNRVSSIEIYHQETCPSAPGAPSLVSPGNGASLAHDAEVTLDWNGVTGATEYYAHLWGGPSIDINSGWTGNTHWFIGTLWPGTYQWQVKARNAYGESGWSSTWSFTIEEPPEPDLRPYTPSGYPYPVVPSSETGTHDVGVLYGGPTMRTYFDWHFTNSGGAAVENDFHVELWVDDTRYLRYPYSSSCAGCTGGFDDWAETISEPGWHTVRLVVDPDNTVQEADEGNNVWEHDFYWESICGDGHELNNDAASATSLSYGQTLSGVICPAGDEDFFAFSGQSGDQIVVDVDARVDGSDLDPYLYLIDSDGTTVLAQNDDEGSGSLDSHLSHVLPQDGTYYLKLRDFSHPNEGGDAYFYSLHLLTDAADPTAQLLTPEGGDYLAVPSVPITVEASDGESGVSRVEFLWHSGDWEDPDWTWLGADWDGSDGWQFDWDTSVITEQSGMAVYAWAFDWAGHWAGVGAYGLTLDHTPPTVVIETSPVYGDAPFRDFWVRWSDSWDNVSGIAAWDIQVRDGLAGLWTDLMIDTTDVSTRFVGEEGHTYYFRARARDNAGNQSTYTDGSTQHTVVLCPTAPDDYENDDSAAYASWITPDEPMQTHNFHVEGDQDWVRFYATAGITYTLATTNTGGDADTVLYLYDRDGTTLIASNDDYPDMWPASRIDWRPTKDGFYWAMVEHWDPYGAGCTTGYGLSITGSASSPLPSRVYLPIALNGQ